MNKNLTPAQIEFRLHLVTEHQMNADVPPLMSQYELEQEHRRLHEQMLSDTGSALHRTSPAAAKARTATCRYCHEPIELISRRWVMVLSGDEGGTYDLCEDNPTTTEYMEDRTHAPVTA